MARKRRSADSGGGGNWMDTYGDMVTLLLTFFVLLFSFSSMDSAKWRSLVESFTGTMPPSQIEVMDPGIEVIPGWPTSQIEEEVTEDEQQEQNEQQSEADLAEQKEKFDKLYRQFRQFIDEEGLTDRISLDRNESIITLRLMDSVLFDPAQDAIKPESEPILSAIGGMLAEYDGGYKFIRIEGHADTDPIHSARFKDNWDLSCMRSTSVWRFLMGASAIDTTKVATAGYGEMHPVATNDTPEGKARNRRVDIVVERY